MTFSGFRLLLFATATISLAFMTVFGLRVISDLARLRATPIDTLQWHLTQTEVDHLRLLNTVHLAEHDHPVTVGSLETVRRQFDIFYSRVSAIGSGTIGDVLEETETGSEIIGSLRAFIEKTAPLIDGSDQELIAALSSIAFDLEALQQEVRSLSLEGVPVFVRTADLRRQAFQRTLFIASLAAGSLIMLLLLMLISMVAQTRLANRRGQMVSVGQARLTAVINSSLDAIVATDANGRIVEYNEAARSIFGYSAGTAIGRDVADMLIPLKHRRQHLDAMQAHRRTGKRTLLESGRVELTALRSDGTEFPVELTVRPLEMAPGSGFVAFIRDISIQVTAARALEEARDQALAADEAKSRFIAVMSHEMRTPLNGLLGTLDLLRDVAMPPNDRELLRVATRSGEILLRHVNDVLDLSRLQKGVMEPADEHVDLRRIIRDVVDLNRAEASAKSIELSAETDERLGAIRGDGHRIRAILLNLVGNAVKFTERGGVDVVARITDVNNDAEIEILVSDSGPGIPGDQEQRIFDDFVMLDDGYGRQSAGSGLGLAISRRLVELMDGTIALVGSSEEGSVFRVRLPYSPAGAATPDVASPALDTTAPGLDDLHVLLVEDNEVNRTVARIMLERNGHRVTDASNGLHALRLVAKEPFDLILMDISMPGLDGVETTRRLRAEPGPNSGTPIFGLTAHAMPEEQARFRTAGMRTCLSKPLRIETLEEALGNLDGPGKPAPADTAAELDHDALADLDANLGRDGFRELLHKVACEMEDHRAAILVASNAGDRMEAAEQAHRLTGTAAVIGTSGIAEISRRIEQAAREGKSEAMTEAAVALSDCVTDTAKALRQIADGT